MVVVGIAFQWHLIVLAICFLCSATSLLTVPPSRSGEAVRAYAWIWLVALAILAVPCTTFSLFFSEDDRLFIRFFDERYLACYLALILVPWCWMLHLRIGRAPRLAPLTPAKAVAILTCSALISAAACQPLLKYREAELRTAEATAIDTRGRQPATQSVGSRTVRPPAPSQRAGRLS